ncbi:MAG: LytTR family DNA-binding domain-containing protein [Pseudomonadota bacterium]
MARQEAIGVIDPAGVTDRNGPKQTARWLGLTGWAILLLGYSLLFILIGQSGPVEGVQRALFNTVPAALLSWPMARLIERHLIDAALWRQSVGHLALGIAFSMFWYIGLQVGYGLQNGFPDGGIVGRALSGAALAWQVFQGMTLYAAIAMFTYAVTFKARLDVAEAARKTQSVQVEPSNDIRQIFVKDGKKLRPVLIRDIVMLSGAGDYTDVLTKDGAYLSGTSLSQFETELPSEHFLRVHRSHIIATDYILSVESGGNGRLTLHMPQGHSVTTSRAGATRLKERAL